MRSFESIAKRLATQRTAEGWEDFRLAHEIKRQLESAYTEGQDEGADDWNHDPMADSQIVDIGEALILQIARIREIRQGIIISADLDAELDKLCFLAQTKADVFGVVA